MYFLNNKEPLTQSLQLWGTSEQYGRFMFQIGKVGSR